MPAVSYSTVAPYYLGGSCASLVAAIWSVLWACSNNRMAVRGAGMILTLTVLDALYALKFGVSAAVYFIRDEAEHLDKDSFHIFNDGCLWAAMYEALVGMASVSLNCCWVVDFVLVLSNPLRNTKQYIKYYALFVVVMSISSTAITAAYKHHEKAAAHTCWIRDDPTGAWAFEAPLYFFIVLAILSLAFSCARLAKGSAETMRARNAIRLRHTAYVLVFILMWTIPAIHQSVDPDDRSLGIAVLTALAVTLQAFVLAIIRFMPDRWCECSRHRKPAFHRHGRVLYTSDDAQPITLAPGSKGAFGMARSTSTSMKGPALHELDGATVTNPVFPVMRQSRRLSAKALKAVSTHPSKSSAPAPAPSSSSSSSPASSSRRAHQPLLSSAPPSTSSSSSGSDNSTTPLYAPPILPHSRSTASAPPTSPTTPPTTATTAPTTDDDDDGAGTGVGAGAGSGAGSSHPSWSDFGQSLRLDLGVFMLAALTRSLHGAEDDTSDWKDRRRRAPAIASPPPGTPTSRAPNLASVTLWQSEQLPSTTESEPSSTTTNSPSRSPGRKAPLFRGSSNPEKGGVGSLPPLSPARTRTFWHGGATDFSVRSTTGEPPVGMKATGDVTAHADADFAALRHQVGLTPTEVYRCLGPQLLQARKIKAHFSSAGSSSFFCRSLDGGLVVKTLPLMEVHSLLRLLPAYLAHLRDQPNSLLCRYYGCFSMKLAGRGGSFTRIHFLLMGNVLPLRHLPPTALTFDLKGSTLGRGSKGGPKGGSSSVGPMAAPSPRARRGDGAETRRLSSIVDGLGDDDEPPPSPSSLDDGAHHRRKSSAPAGSTPAAAPLHQDQAFRDIFPAGLEIPADVQGPLLSQLTRDVALLADHGLMDYSLLLSVVPAESDADCLSRSWPPSKPGFPLSLDKPVNLSTGDLRRTLDCVTSVFERTTAPRRTRTGSGLSTDSLESSDHHPRLLRWSPLCCSLGRVMVNCPPGQSPGPPPPYHLLLQMGVIDLLQPYNLQKRMERGVKILKHRRFHPDISSVNPATYVARFTGMVTKAFHPETSCQLGPPPPTVPGPSAVRVEDSTYSSDDDDDVV